MNDITLWLLLLLLSAIALAAVLALRARSLRDRVEQLELEVARLAPLFDERHCRVCDCTDAVACWAGCWWVEEDLCSSCADDLAAEGSSLEGGRR